MPILNMVGGGNNSVKQIYKLFTQATEPTSPQQGWIWVKPNKAVAKTTLSLDVPTSTVDGELLLQFTNIVYEMNFQKISDKITGNINTGVYVFNINALTKESITNNFIPLFQKDVVKEYGVLKNIYQYNSTIGIWETPESYYYNGTSWVDMTYRIYTKFNDNSIEKRIPETMAVSSTILNITTEVFKFCPNGTFYGKALTGGNLVITKYNGVGTIISTLTIPPKDGFNPSNAFYVDDFGNIYVNYYKDTYVSVLSLGGQYLRKISPTGEVIWTMFVGSQYNINLFLGAGYGKIIFERTNVSGAAKGILIIDCNIGSFNMVNLGYDRNQSNPIFEADGFYILSDSSSSAGANFEIYKFSYNGTVIKSASSSYQMGGNYILGLTEYSSSRISIYKDVAVDTFFIVYSLNNIKNSINKLTCNFIAKTMTSIFKNAIPCPQGYSSAYNSGHNMLSTSDLNGNIYTIWYNVMSKYKNDGVQIYNNIGTKVCISNWITNGLTDCHLYYRGI